jgi:hypothetical protein
MGESTGGKYIGPFNKGLDQYIERGGKISLHANILGNPFQAGVRQRLLSYKTARALSLIDESNFDQVARLKQICLEKYSN